MYFKSMCTRDTDLQYFPSDVLSTDITHHTVQLMVAWLTVRFVMPRGKHTPDKQVNNTMSNC